LWLVSADLWTKRHAQSSVSKILSSHYASLDNPILAKYGEDIEAKSNEEDEVCARISHNEALYCFYISFVSMRNNRRKAFVQVWKL
jgi:hypothetical protein